MAVLQIRPNDRPIRLYCRVCRIYVNDVGWTRDGKPCSPEIDISKTECGRCKTLGSLVFHEVSTEIKWKPHCGNEKCDGTCNDLLCIPPTPDKKIAEQEKPYWFRFIWIGYCAGIITGYLIWSH